MRAFRSALATAMANPLVVRMIAFMALLWTIMKPTPTRGFIRNAAAFVSLAPALAIAGVVLATIIGVLLLAALAPEFFNATGDLTDAFTNSGLGGTAGVIIGILAIVVPLVLVFAFVTLVMRVAKK